MPMLLLYHATPHHTLSCNSAVRRHFLVITPPALSCTA
jgi:hypothetical protein